MIIAPLQFSSFSLLVALRMEMALSEAKNLNAADK